MTNFEMQLRKQVAKSLRGIGLSIKDISELTQIPHDQIRDFLKGRYDRITSKNVFRLADTVKLDVTVRR